ncbi:hypothetical protein NL676_033941 [Syzygium grande]|nr:hypothetical protein NL676_033941 [Syzygium grande]
MQGLLQRVGGFGSNMRPIYNLEPQSILSPYSLETIPPATISALPASLAASTDQDRPDQASRSPASLVTHSSNHLAQATHRRAFRKAERQSLLQISVEPILQKICNKAWRGCPLPASGSGRPINTLGRSISLSQTLSRQSPSPDALSPALVSTPSIISLHPSLVAIAVAVARGLSLSSSATPLLGVVSVVVLFAPLALASWICSLLLRDRLRSRAPALLVEGFAGCPSVGEILGILGVDDLGSKGPPLGGDEGGHGGGGGGLLYRLDLLEEVLLRNLRQGKPSDALLRLVSRLCYPGDVAVTATYTLTSSITMRLDMEGVPNKATPISLA